MNRIVLFVLTLSLVALVPAPANADFFDEAAEALYDAGYVAHEATRVAYVVTHIRELVHYWRATGAERKLDKWGRQLKRECLKATAERRADRADICDASAAYQAERQKQNTIQDLGRSSGFGYGSYRGYLGLGTYGYRPDPRICAMFRNGIPPAGC